VKPEVILPSTKAKCALLVRLENPKPCPARSHAIHAMLDGLGLRLVNWPAKLAQLAHTLLPLAIPSALTALLASSNLLLMALLHHAQPVLLAPSLLALGQNAASSVPLVDTLINTMPLFVTNVKLDASKN